jgi:MinD-like ATPase involved in chromosome partitioning or flagellar assembly
MNPMPQVLVVGSPAFAETLAACGAQWAVFPAVPDLDVLWAKIDEQTYPNSAAALIVEDGQYPNPDMIPASLGAFMPYASVFLIADSARGATIARRAQEFAEQSLAQQGHDVRLARAVTVLPPGDLPAILATIRQVVTVERGVIWPALDLPAAAALEVAPAVTVSPQATHPASDASTYGQPATETYPQAAPAYRMAVAAEYGYPATTHDAPSATPSAVHLQPVMMAEPAYAAHDPAYGAAAPVVAEPLSDTPSNDPATAGERTFEANAGGAPDYEQAGIYSNPAVHQILASGLAKRSDALPGQMTIACMSSKGGSGKSTTAISLAGMIAKSSAAAGEPKKVVIVDLDTRDGQVGSLINQYRPTAVNIRLMPRIDASTVTKFLVHDKRLGIDALLAPIRPRNADDVGPDFYRQVIQVLQTTHDVVIIDCSVNYLDPLLGVAFGLADEILFVTTLAATSVQGMARAMTELFADPSEGGLGIAREKVGVVANQVILNVGMNHDTLMKAALGTHIVGQIPAEHDEVLIQTNACRMDNLLKHPRLGPAYFKLAKRCLPGWNLAPLTAEAAAVAARMETPAGADQQAKKRLFGR